jgi:4-hydroxybenzoate polyprenyltransferase
MLGVLLLAAVAILLLNPVLALAGGAYVALQISYTLWLKHVPVVDIFALASGFVLRVLAGSMAVGVQLSSWMFITTLCLAVHLAAAKRLHEMKVGGPDTRPVLRAYTMPVLEYYVGLSAICAVVFYGLFVATVRHALVPTTVFVMFGIFRYRYSIEKGETAEFPVDVLLGDRVLLACVATWAISCFLALWIVPV